MKRSAARAAVCTAVLCGGLLTGCLFDFDETAQQIIHGGKTDSAAQAQSERTREDILYEIQQLERELAELDAQNPPFEFEPEGSGVIITKVLSDTVTDIPEEIDGRPVTGIGEYACSGVRGLHEVRIPATVTHIDAYAFNGSSVESVIFAPESTLTVGEYAFEDCPGLCAVTFGGETEIMDYAFMDSGISDIVFADGCDLTFGEYVFENCRELKYLRLTGRFSIGSYDFLHCAGLETVEISDAQFRLDEWAFTESGIEHFFTENSRGSIGEKAFQRCNKLCDVWLRRGVTAVGKKAFADCTGLQTAYFAKSVTRIGEGVFDGCYPFLILTPKDSTAQQYAEEQELSWSEWNEDSE